MQKVSKKITVLLTIWVILIFIGVGSISYISGKANQKYEDSIYYYKVINAPTRSYCPTFQQDSIYMSKEEKRLLKEYEKLIR